MLAMVVNDNAGCLMPSGASSSIASMLAPTRAFTKFPPDQRQLLTYPASDTIANYSR